jgi:hypothetical protein
MLIKPTKQQALMGYEVWKMEEGTRILLCMSKMPAIQEKYFPTNRKLLLHAQFIKGREIGGGGGEYR